jgi:hypothetical protein
MIILFPESFGLPFVIRATPLDAFILKKSCPDSVLLAF